jgi:hypothetical protein
LKGILGFWENSAVNSSQRFEQISTEIQVEKKRSFESCSFSFSRYVLLAKTGLNKRNGGSCKKIIGEQKSIHFSICFFFFPPKKPFAKFIVLQNLFSTVLSVPLEESSKKHEIHLKILNENNNYYKNYKIFIT